MQCSSLYKLHERNDHTGHIKGNQFSLLGTLQNLRIQCECVTLDTCVALVNPQQLYNVRQYHCYKHMIIINFFNV